SVERERARTAAEKARLFDGYQAGVLPLGELQRRVPEVDRRRLELQQQQAELEARRAELANHNRLRGRITTFAQRVRRGLEQLDFAGRQRLLRLLVEEVRVTGGRVQIRLRIPLDDPPPDPPDARNAEPPDPHKPGGSSVLPLRSRYSEIVRIADLLVAPPRGQAMAKLARNLLQLGLAGMAATDRVLCFARPRRSPRPESRRAAVAPRSGLPRCGRSAPPTL